MFCRAKGAGFVPSAACWNDVQRMKFKGGQGDLSQRNVRVVRRVKRAAKNTDLARRWRQTQSRLGKKWVVKRSSCEPASTGR